MSPAPQASQLLIGRVRHRRHRPRPHGFTFGAYHALLDLDDLARLDAEVVGLGVNRPGPFGFRDTDHLGAADEPVRDKLAAWLAGHGVALPDGPVRVLTSLRVLGYVFDPVTWWFCHTADGGLAFVVAEVHNTFGDAHAYLLDDLERPSAGTYRARADKVLHVSPFLPVDGLTYRFAFALGAGRLAVHVAVDDDEGRIFDASQSGHLVPLTTTRLWWQNLVHPLLTWRVIIRIHREALGLLRRRIPFFSRPTPPPDGFMTPSAAAGDEPARARRTDVGVGPSAVPDECEEPT